jgi:hypothetical protein
MLRGFLLRARASAPLALVVVAACAGVSNGGALSLPRGRATVVTLENARYDPPRSIGLVSANHPGVQRADADLRRSGFKRAENGAIDALLDRLEEQGFLQSGVVVQGVRPLDPRTQLARLTVTIDRQIVDFTVPRHPAKEVADRYTEMAHSVSELFNHVVDLRPSTQDASGDLFLEMQQRLYESNSEKLKTQSKPGSAP